MFANTQRGGWDCAYPDVSGGEGGTPAPQLSLADGALGVPAVYDVLFAGAPAHNLSTVILRSVGGAAGIVSRTRAGPCRTTSAVGSVLIGGMPATRLGGSSSHNSGNAQGARLTPSQTKVLLLGR
jgi:uncharacterized protein DUF4150